MTRGRKVTAPSHVIMTGSHSAMGVEFFFFLHRQSVSELTMLPVTFKTDATIQSTAAFVTRQRIKLSRAV